MKSAILTTGHARVAATAHLCDWEIPVPDFDEGFQNVDLQEGVRLETVAGNMVHHGKYTVVYVVVISDKVL